ncbi:AGE family epimerase/isomerase [Pseudomonas sp. DCB_CB]|jgi:mannose-6-phosphate isomerase|uniref:AGE family epimerase/isomerase n=1 Tax=Pseudomonas TaxID=286 RepID=UPI00157002EA|nr:MULTISPECIES: AGE family epimerase/isomerase [Pseudomonas]MCE0992741.1 AGE family epimerase/isomerase [Pseudomonas alloputida]MCF1252639.1 AGE family epimerase/isomerase [Pseudomonas putida]MCX2694576.1 AGE family epimerase/isomerase [Pseudomonas sp. DCB_BZ]MCX2855008.1 AGE family epimerase/isomerase [Pseudomonas sp. DCB_CB]QKL09707.1 N-acylglucosamine 2-epimerase [Pseudomonas putida]
MSDPRPTLPELARFNQHFAERIVPLWQGPGWNADMALPYEALDAQHHPLPVQRYRAMACARQLYVFSSRIGQPGAAERAAALFRSLQKHFHDAEHGGWFYSIDAQGKPLDRRKDLYTHAFIVFACAHYWGKVRESLVESTLNAALDIIDQQFARDDGLYEACLGEDWADLGSGPLQNPQMHLAEAFLQVLAVRGDEHVRQSLLQLCQALEAHFIEPAHGLMLEKPHGAVDNWFEPGHQFEWFYLLHTSPLLRDTPLHASIDRAFGFAEQFGVKDAAVLAMLNVDGRVLDASQRIWAQAEYLRALTLREGSEAKLAGQLGALSARFLRDAGWYECRGVDGVVSRDDMPSTTPYHLATCLEGLNQLNT